MIETRHLNLLDFFWDFYLSLVGKMNWSSNNEDSWMELELLVLVFCWFRVSWTPSVMPVVCIWHSRGLQGRLEETWGEGWMEIQGEGEL
jgi:hypothetical protein